MRKTLAMLLLPAAAFAETRLVSVGDHELAISCSGTKVNATVILAAGGGRTAADWSKVEPEIAKFTRVCSYDRAGLGKSEKTVKDQSVGEIIADLHALLAAAGERGPFLLAGHSIAGVYVRKYAAQFPKEVAGLVLVDGSHEEQVWRLKEIAPDMPGLPNAAVQGFFIEKGQLLDWRTSVPMIVLSHGERAAKTMPPGMTEPQRLAFEACWQELQIDMAKRSPKGELRRAMDSTHYIHLDQPDMVIHAIRDVWQQSR